MAKVNVGLKEIEEAVVAPKRVTVQSIVDKTILHGEYFNAFEVVTVGAELAKELIATGYFKEVKSREV